MQSTAPQPRTSFRPFPLAFVDHSNVITEEYNSRGVSPENPWLLLTSDAVVAALQKHILQVTHWICAIAFRSESCIGCSPDARHVVLLSFVGVVVFRGREHHRYAGDT